MTSNNPIKISVIIPAYNRSALLPYTVASVLGQKGADIEIIIVDDGSSDDTFAVAKALADQHPSVRAITYSPNRGGNHARNRGLELATGDYVTFLDSDDILLPQWAETITQTLQSIDNAPNTVLHCQMSYFIGDSSPPTTFPEQGTPARGMNSCESPGDYLFLNGGSGHFKTLVVPIELARSLRLDETLPRLQDFAWWLSVASHMQSYQFIPRVLAAYRIQHSGPQVSKLNTKHLQVLAWRNRIRHQLSPRADAALVSNYIAFQALINGDNKTAIPLLLKGLRHRVLNANRATRALARIALPASMHKALREML